MRELEVNFVSETCRGLLREAVIEAEDVAFSEGEDVVYRVEDRVLDVGDEPTFLVVESERAAEELGLDGPLRLVFNDPAVAETERCCFMDKIRLAEELARTLVKGRVEEFVDRIEGLPEHALLEFAGDPRYEPVAMVPSPV